MSFDGLSAEIPHDGELGYEWAEDELLHKDIEAIMAGRDFSARDIFGGHPVVHEVLGETIRDLCDSNRSNEFGPDGRFKTHGMNVTGGRLGIKLWESGLPSEGLRKKFISLIEKHTKKLNKSVEDSRTKLQGFFHTMPGLANDSSTSEVPAGEPNSIFSIGNGGNVLGEGENVMLPPDHVMYLKFLFEKYLLEEFKVYEIRQYLSGTDPVRLNDYSGHTSSLRTTSTRTREKASLLLEANRSFAGHPDDPEIKLLKEAGKNAITPVDRRKKLRRVVENVLSDYTNSWMYRSRICGYTS